MLQTEEELVEILGESPPDLPELRLKPITFDQRMALEMAYGMELPDTIRKRYNIDDLDWDVLRRSQLFRDCVSKYLTELKRNGTTFRAKAQALAEDVLWVSHKLAVDTEIPPAVRLESVKWLAKVSGHDESGKKDIGSGTMVQVNINLG